mmetsp:Transcript_11505/g.27066  ORF Transcript_11505/g.27066 Transcript_11505/m.27066 type:complete len:449 (+) Transcript_11505:60-1406(+)
MTTEKQSGEPDAKATHKEGDGKYDWKYARDERGEIIWTEEMKLGNVRSLFKAEKMLEDVLFRMNMYSLAAEHYNNMNNTMFVTPSIITTSFASFCSFLAATDPVHGKNISLFVGALGTCATIITAMQSAYKFDTKAEAFRTAAAEYRLLQTRIMGSMRKDKNLKEEWTDLWKEVEMRMTELQKKMQYFPARHLVDNWNAQGKLHVKSGSGSLLPPYLLPFEKNLEDDGIVSEEDLRYIPDELFELWETANYLPDAKDSDHNALYSPSPEEEHDLDVERGLVTRYPLVVINKLRDTRDRMVALSKGSNRSKGAPLGHYLKPTTQAALRKRGFLYTSDLRLATDEVLDSVIRELIIAKTPPMPVAWTNFEETVQEVLRFGHPSKRFRSWFKLKLSEKAQERVGKVIAESSAQLEELAGVVDRDRVSSLRLSSGFQGSPPTSGKMESRKKV